MDDAQGQSTVLSDASDDDAGKQINYDHALQAVRKKEQELSQRTELLEGMMRMLTNALSGIRPPESPTSAFPQTPGSPSQTLHFQTPKREYLSEGNLTPHASTGLLAPGYPKSYLREALELVPKYDGHNIPVWQFARACKRARESVPLVDEAAFVKMLRNKLTHHAYLVVEDEIHPTVEKFLDVLKRVFGPGRSANYYRGQLSIAFKKPHEHILDYIGRIKDLRTAIIEGDQTNLDRPLLESELSAIDSFALEAFYEGLPREYRLELRAEGYNGFPDACNKTIIIGKRLEREEARTRNLRPNRPNLPPTNHASQEATANTTVTGTERKICSYCKNLGHLVHECRKRQYNLRQNNNNGDHTTKVGIGHSGINSRSQGNTPEVSSSGTTRGLGSARPAFTIDYAPGPSTYSERAMETFQQLSLDATPSEDQSHSCSTQGLTPI